MRAVWVVVRPAATVDAIDAVDSGNCSGGLCSCGVYSADRNRVGQGLFARLLAGDELCSSRLVLWSNVLHLIVQKPWLGWGWGELDFAHFMTLYNGPRVCDILDNAHNLPLHLAVELGVPVALLVCGGFAWWVLRQKPWAERDAARQMAWAVIALILLHSMLEYPLWYGPFQIAFVLCLLILWRRPTSVIYTRSNAANTSNMPVTQVNIAQAAIISIASVVALTAIVYAAWDYHRVSQIYLQPEVPLAVQAKACSQQRSKVLATTLQQGWSVVQLPRIAANDKLPKMAIMAISRT